MLSNCDTRFFPFSCLEFTPVYSKLKLGWSFIDRNPLKFTQFRSLLRTSPLFCFEKFPNVKEHWRWRFTDEDLMGKCWLLIRKEDFSWCLLLPALWTGFLTKRNKKNSEFSQKFSYQVVAIVYLSLKLHYKCSIPFSHCHFCIWPGNVNCNDIYIYSFTCFELSETLMCCNLFISNIAKIDFFHESIPASRENLLL